MTTFSLFIVPFFPFRYGKTKKTAVLFLVRSHKLDKYGGRKLSSYRLLFSPPLPLSVLPSHILFISLSLFLFIPLSLSLSLSLSRFFCLVAFIIFFSILLLFWCYLIYTVLSYFFHFCPSLYSYCFIVHVFLYSCILFIITFKGLSVASAGNA